MPVVRVVHVVLDIAEVGYQRLVTLSSSRYLDFLSCRCWALLFCIAEYTGFITYRITRYEAVPARYAAT